MNKKTLKTKILSGFVFLIRNIGEMLDSLCKTAEGNSEISKHVFNKVEDQVQFLKSLNKSSEELLMLSKRLNEEIKMFKI